MKKVGIIGASGFIGSYVTKQFLDKHPHISFELTSVSSVRVMGKALSTRQDSTSMGLQYLIKNKITPDNFIKAIFDQDDLFSIVDVVDVATISGLHGKDDLLSGESNKISGLRLMLNHQKSNEKEIVVYKSNLARKVLAIDFIPIKPTLDNQTNQ